MGDGEKIEWVRAENARLRRELAERSAYESGMTIREVRSWGGFDATPDEAWRLIARVQSVYPMLAWEVPAGRDPVEVEREYARQFRASMAWLSKAARREEGPDYGRSLSFWIEQAEGANRARDGRFAYTRLLASYVTGSGPAFSSILTTIALYDSSFRWFEARSCKLASRGLSLFSCAARPLWKCLTHSSSLAPSWHTFVEMPAAVGFRPALTQVPSNYWSKFENPATIADNQSALSQEILDVSIAQCEPEIEPDGVPNDLRRKPMAGIGNKFHDRTSRI